MADDKKPEAADPQPASAPVETPAEAEAAPEQEQEKAPSINARQQDVAIELDGSGKGKVLVGEVAGEIVRVTVLSGDKESDVDEWEAASAGIGVCEISVSSKTRGDKVRVYSA